jgi:ataxia telangiectasia mutated family protein
MYIDRKTQEIKQRGDQIARTQRGSKDHQQLTQAQSRAEAMLVQDQANLQQNSGARDTFLERAIDMYSRCLAASDAFDDDGAIRLCSLWFANFQETSLQDKVRYALERVPSRKFVFLAHQLSARLSASPSGQIGQNQTNLQALVFRMCREHPFHSLYQVYALRPERSADSDSTNSRRQSSRHELSSQADRASAAGEIFDRLRGDNINGERVRAVELVCDASLQWAKHPIKDDSRFQQKSKEPFQIPDHLLIRKIENLPVPIVTSHTPLDPTLRYDNCVCIARFEHTFDTAGGINLPKIAICVGNDGKRYKQLVRILSSLCMPLTHTLIFQSSRAKEVMTCGRMQSWNKFSDLSTSCYSVTVRRENARSVCVITKSYLWHLKLACWSSWVTRCLCGSGY